MTTLIAYHGKPQVKAKYLKRIRDHRAADELVQGEGWVQNGTTRGCAVGCTFNKYDHTRGPVEIGVPTLLMRLEDSIFEGLPRKEALDWPERFLKAIPTGADLSMVWPRFACWLLEEKRWGNIFEKSPKAKEAVKAVHALFTEWVATGTKPSDERFRSARAYADAAAYAAAAAAYATYAAYAAAAADAYAADAATYAAYAAAAADAYAADAAADARKNTRQAFWRTAAGELERLLKSAPKAAVA